MTESLFTPLIGENLTTLIINYNWKNDEFNLFSAREWNSELDWSNYNKAFNRESVLLSNRIFFDNKETEEIFEKYDMGKYLEKIKMLIRKGRHMRIDCFLNKRKNIRFIGNIHSNALGLHNGFDAIRAGGIRRHGFCDSELEVIIDGLNLSRAMSYKNAGALLPFGGSKITVHSNPVELNDLDSMAFLAYCLDRTRTVTGPDMGFVPAMADVFQDNKYSFNIVGGQKGKFGPTGGPTALGIYLAIKAAHYFLYGTDELNGKNIVVQGVGAVGFPLVEKYLMTEDVNIFVADVNQDSVSKLCNMFPDKVKEIDVSKVLTQSADIFVPCAIGGIIDEACIEGLKYKIIMGAANNQLKATNSSEEIRLAKLLEKKGILFQTDWIHNAGGVIAGMEEYMQGDNATMESMEKQINKACKLGTLENLTEAKKEGITPTERAYNYFGSKIYF